MQPFEVTSLGVRDFAFQSQLSRCLVHTDCMMLDNTLLCGMEDKDIFAAVIHQRTVPTNDKIQVSDSSLLTTHVTEGQKIDLI